MALPGNSYNGHTGNRYIGDMERTIGTGITSVLADAEYRCHKALLS